ncbi:MAG: hypothetical protein HYU69_01285 [Bacteroidetes bacterium]|nr:hypothetical protein [Bacteroidota bacterium]
MNTEDDKTKIRKQLKYLLILLLLLIGSGIGNVFFMLNRNSLNTERDTALLHADSSLSVKLQVEKYLMEAQAALNNCKSNNDELNAAISKLNNEITEKRTVIEKITKDNGNVSALRKQLKDTKKLRDDCEKQVNSILKGNGDLQAKIAALNKTLADLKKDNEGLKKKLEWAKDLKAYEVGVMNYKVTKSKQKPTIRAKKVNRISVSFTLAENMVAESGSKNIYLVIYDPQKSVLAKTSEKFTNTKTNTEQVYSSLKTIDFKNDEQKITVNYDTDDKLTKGKYKMEIYADGSLSGKKEFELR